MMMRDDQGRERPNVEKWVLFEEKGVWNGVFKS